MMDRRSSSSEFTFLLLCFYASFFSLFLDPHCHGLSKDAQAGNRFQKSVQRLLDETNTADGARTTFPTHNIRWHPSLVPQPSVDDRDRIWRNARKRSSPALWRYALRCYTVSSHTGDPTAAAGALQACAKLGDWQRAVEIYESVTSTATTTTTTTTTKRTPKTTLQKTAQQQQPNQRQSKKDKALTETMLMSTIRACVRDGSNPALAAARSLLRAAQLATSFPVVAHHVNALAAAHVRAGQPTKAVELLDTYLQPHSTGPEPENGPVRFNVYNVGSRDKASYGLVVQAALQSNNWTAATAALANMTAAGLYPTARQLHQWTQGVGGRGVNSHWKKKREEYCLDATTTDVAVVEVDDDEQDGGM